MAGTATEGVRQAILDAAITRFARKGYAGTSVHDILADDDLSKPALYYHFKSKAGLFRAILDFAFDESYEAMQQAVQAQKTCADRLVGLTTAFFAFAERRRNLMRLMISAVFAAPEEIPPEVIDVEKRRRNFQLAADVVRAGQLAGELDPGYDPGQMAHAIFGAISHQVRTHLLAPEGRLDHARAQCTVSLFLNGARSQMLSK